MTEHLTYTVEQNDVVRKTDWAIRYNPPAVKNEDGSTTVSLNFPILLATDLMGKTEATLQAFADVLNKAEGFEAFLEEIRGDIEAAISEAKHMGPDWLDSGPADVITPLDRALAEIETKIHDLQGDDQ